MQACCKLISCISRFVFLSKEILQCFHSSILIIVKLKSQLVHSPRSGLLVGLEEAKGSVLCLYDLGLSRVVKAVVIPGRVSSPLSLSFVFLTLLLNIVQ